MSATVSVASQTFVNQHGVHALTVAGPAVALAVFATAADIRARCAGRVSAPFTAHRALAVTAALFGLVATFVHVRVAPEHFHEAIAFGVFFTVTAACQLGWSALMLTRPKRWTVWAGLVGNLAVLLLWAYTRLVSVPIGPEAGRPEEIGGWDVLATTAEAAVVVFSIAILWLGRTRSRQQPTPAPAETTATAPVLALVAPRD